MIKIQAYKRFCKNELHVDTWLTRLHDQRKRPQIPTAQLAWFTMSMVPFQVQSLLQADHLGRQPGMRQFADSLRALVASDSTLQRVLRTLPAKPLEAAGATLETTCAGRGLTKQTLPSGRKLRVAITDGSGVGKRHVSIVMLAGQRDLPLAVEGTTKKGKELRTSRKAWASLHRNLGKGWCDLMCYDALGATKEDFRAWRDLYGGDLLVKTRETGLQLQEAAQEIFTHGVPGQDVEEASGFDSTRGCSYTIRVARQLPWDKEQALFTVAWVREAYVKPPKGRPAVVAFWVITTRADLTARDLRELAHGRWRIEGFFKRLNALVKSKRCHTKDLKTLEALLRLWCLGYCCLEAFLASLDEILNRHYRHLRLTYKLLVDHFRFTLHDLEGVAPDG